MLSECVGARPTRSLASKPHFAGQTRSHNRTILMSNIPADLKYAKSHEWLKAAANPHKPGDADMGLEAELPLQNSEASAQP